jgi:HlyD family secretion protein
MKRFFKIIILVVVVTIAVVGVRWRLNAKKNNSGGHLKIYGNVDIRDANLAFREQERIVRVLVKEGDRVEAGQVLARSQ